MLISFVFSRAFLLLLSFLFLKSWILFFWPQINRIVFIRILGLWSNIITVHKKKATFKKYIYFASVISTFESISKPETNIFSPCSLLFQLPICSTHAIQYRFLPPFLSSSLPSFFSRFLPSFCSIWLHFHELS